MSTTRGAGHAEPPTNSSRPTGSPIPLTPPVVRPAAPARIPPEPRPTAQTRPIAGGDLHTNAFQGVRIPGVLGDPDRALSKRRVDLPTATKPVVQVLLVGIISTFFIGLWSIPLTIVALFVAWGLVAITRQAKVRRIASDQAVLDALAIEWSRDAGLNCSTDTAALLGYTLENSPSAPAGSVVSMVNHGGDIVGGTGTPLDIALVAISAARLGWFAVRSAQRNTQVARAREEAKHRLESPLVALCHRYGGQAKRIRSMAPSATTRERLERLAIKHRATWRLLEQVRQG